jgi:hypothetical protein
LFGRLAGALKYISPWKPRPNPDDHGITAEDMDDDEDQLGDGGADFEQGYGDQDAAELQEFAKTLPNRTDRPHSGQDHLDESTEISAADTSLERNQHLASGLQGRDGEIVAMTDFGGVGGDHGGAVFGGSGGSFRGANGGAAASGGASRELGISGDGGFGAGFGSGTVEEGDGGFGGGLMVRPRGVRKWMTEPLRVAQTVSRMGKENVQRKRVLAEKFALQELKAYMVLVNTPSCRLLQTVSAQLSSALLDVTYQEREESTPLRSTPLRCKACWSCLSR